MPAESVDHQLIRVTELTKYYGKDVGVKNLTFSISAGEVLGFLGPNGAGKTTAMRLLVGLIHATSGTAEILNRDALRFDASLRSHIGYLPGVLELYKRMSGFEFLKFLSRIRGIDCRDYALELARKFNVDLNRHISDLSKGNRQKIGVIQAFMHKPEVLILDEPTAGLDPIVQREFEEVLSDARNRGAAIMLSSHVLSEVEHLADRVAVVDQGQMVALEHISALKERALRTLDLTFREAVPPTLFEHALGVASVSVRNNVVTCEVVGAETELLKIAVEHEVVQVRSREVSLEDIFLSLVQAGGR